MRTLDRYVLREWGRIFFVVLLGFPILVIVIELTDNLNRYLGRGLTKGTVALAFAYGMPNTMFLVLPAAVLFATVFTVGVLGRHSEITAAKASGISFHRLTRPLFAAGIASFLAGIGIGELVPIGYTRKSILLGEKAIRTTGSRFNFVYRADRGWVYAIRSLDVSQRQVRDVVLDRQGTGPEYPTVVVAAPRASYDSAARGDPRHWTLYNGTIRLLLEADREREFAYQTMVMPSFSETPEDLLAEPKAPEEMRYFELGRYIDALARSGSDVRKLAVDRALKLSIPFTCIIIALFGAPLAITSPRSGAAWGIAASLATTFIFLLLEQLSRAIGGGGLLPPTLSAWVPNLFFGVGAGWLLARAKT